MELQQQSQQLQGQELEHVSSFYKSCVQDDEQPKHNFGSNLGEIEFMSVDQCDDIREVDDSQLVGALDGAVIKDADVAVREDDWMVDVEVKFAGAGKRKRGRPPGAGLVKTTRHPPPTQRKKREEEDVCFICFDGGSLVLCDRRGCPKAYHPSCIKRDESFFRSKAKWNCGWHICSSCQKASFYMCYTCTYSLCKACTKDADYFSVRGNKGFCGTCMRTIMLIENCSLPNQEKVQVDFDDKSSWEYLFKVYWMYLKGKLYLTLDELVRAKNPWTGPTITAPKGASSGEFNDGTCNIGRNSENLCGNLEANHAKRRKTKRQPEFLHKLNSLNMEQAGGDKRMTLPERTKWATDELLELVAHMKNGDTSMMSQFDVQALLLEYIKRNNLRDSRRKCQIVCDSRLFNLFGRARVGHFEMLKLLESHLLNRGNSIPITGVVHAVSRQVEVSAKNDNHLMVGNDKRRKIRKKADKREQVNPDEYAAIDVHNVNLIYLKRSLAENLIGENDKFHDKVVGLFVRIKISGSDQKQDMYRLVQVIGTGKTAEPYKIGETKTDVMLEILNLRKKEMLPIDVISNQDFSEDECRRLRQSIKCGLIKFLTVGEIQEKAMTLQALRINESLEAEILRLNHLRDRASEKGHIKELRECVEKLQLLNSPDERKRRLLGTPEVHTDPTMDPSYESEEDAGEFDEKKSGDLVRPRNPSFDRKERGPFSAQKICDVLNDMGRAQKNSAATLERNMNMSTTFYVDREATTRVHQKVNESQWNQGKESFELANNQVSLPSSETGCWNNDAVGRSESFSRVPSGDFLPLNSAGIVQPVSDFETDKIWHYQDPTGKIQGPFSMVQLRKWSTSGHFPPDLRVWRVNQKQDDSVLLTDALCGRYHKEPLLLYNNCLTPQEVRATSDGRGKNWDGERSRSVDTAPKYIKVVEGGLDFMQNDDNIHCEATDEVVKSNGWGSQSSSLTPLVDANSNKGQIGSLLSGWDSVKGNSSWPDQPAVCNSLPSPTPSEKPCESLSHQVKEGWGADLWKSNQSNLDGNSQKITEGQIIIRDCSDKQVDSEDNLGQSAGQNCRPPPIDRSSNVRDSNSSFASLTKSLETADHNQDIHFSDMSSPTPKLSHLDLQVQAPEIKQSLSSSSDAPVQDPASSSPDQPSEWNSLPSPTPSEKPCDILSRQENESQGGEMRKSNRSSLDRVSHGTNENRSDIGHSNDKKVDSEANSGLSSGQNFRPPPIDSSRNGWHSSSQFVSLAKSLEISDQNQEIDFSDLPSPTPKRSNHSNLDRVSRRTTEDRGNIEHNNDEQVNSEGNSGQSSGKNCRPPAIDGSINGWHSNSTFVTFANSLEISDQNQEIDFSDLPGPTPKPSHTTEDQSDIGHSNCKQVDSEGNSGQSSEQNCRPLPIDSTTDNWHSNPAFVSLAKSLEVSDQNQDIDFSDLPSPTPKPSHLDLQDQDEIKNSMTSDAPGQDSGRSWSTASSPVAGGPQLPEVAGEWVGYSPTAAKPSVEEWESDLLPASSLKPTEVASDHAATPTSGSCQFTHSSPSHPASNAASWQAIVVTEPDEFTTLSEESVSDLLAEVEAMESLNGLASPSSTLRCGVELTQGSENDCFSPLAGFSPTLDTGRSASLSSSSDLQIHSQSTVTDEPLGVSQTDSLDPQKNSGGRSSTSNDAVEETKYSDDSVNQCEVASDIPPPLPPVTSWDMAAIDTSWRSGSETTSISQEGVQGNANLGLGGLAQGITNVDWGTDQWTAQDHGSMTLGTSVGNPGIWGSQPRYGGDRLSCPRDRDFNGRDSSFGRGRPVWNRHAICHDGNGGNYLRPPPKGQRVCKFYESGYCKKGSSCSFWHPI